MISEERVSRFLSLLLRHRPPDYPLAFDERGFVAWEDLFETVWRRFPEITEEELRGVIENSDKKRFELAEGKVRATYGHSFPVALGLESIEPPAELYHGTARDLAGTILQAGLRPRGRQFVHLSPTVEEAVAVGRRGDPHPEVVIVAAREAHASGIEFYQSGPLFLTRAVPPKFLSLQRR